MKRHSLARGGCRLQGCRWGLAPAYEVGVGLCSGLEAPDGWGKGAGSFVLPAWS